MRNTLLTTTAILLSAGIASADGHASVSWSGTATAGIARAGGALKVKDGKAAVVSDAGKLVGGTTSNVAYATGLLNEINAEIDVIYAALVNMIQASEGGVVAGQVVAAAVTSTSEATARSDLAHYTKVAAANVKAAGGSIIQKSHQESIVTKILQATRTLDLA